MKNVLLDKGIILPSGEISKDKVNLVTGAITQPFAEMVWVTTGGDMETVNRLTDVLVTMNTPADRGKLFKIIKMLYGLMGLLFSEEAEPMDADPAVLEYFIFSFTADFGEVIQKRKIKYGFIKYRFHSYPFPKSLALRRGSGYAAGTETKGSDRRIQRL